MTERRTATTDQARAEEDLAPLAELSPSERAALVELDDEGRAALAELVAGGADTAPSEVAEVPAVVDPSSPAEVAEVDRPRKGRGVARPLGGTVTDRARRAAAAEPAEETPAE